MRLPSRSRRSSLPTTRVPSPRSNSSRRRSPSRPLLETPPRPPSSPLLHRPLPQSRRRHPPQRPAPTKPAASPAPAAEVEEPAAKAETTGCEGRSFRSAPRRNPHPHRLAQGRSRQGALRRWKTSPDDGQLVRNVHEEAQKLLEKVETVRGDKNKPLAGTLGDTWWDLINLKSQAAKLSNARRRASRSRARAPPRPGKKPSRPPRPRGAPQP
jgi:hypothetical protein